MNLPENPTEEEFQAWLADPETPPLPELQWAHQVVEDELPFCGCNNPEDSWDWLRDLLEIMADRPGAAVVDYLGGYSGPNQLLLGILQHAGLAEHGSGIYGSWPTDKGRRFLAVMRVAGYDDLRCVGFPSGPNPGAYEMVVNDGWHIIRKAVDKTVAFQTGNADAAVRRLAELNGKVPV